MCGRNFRMSRFPGLHVNSECPCTLEFLECPVFPGIHVFRNSRIPQIFSNVPFFPDFRLPQNSSKVPEKSSKTSMDRLEERGASLDAVCVGISDVTSTRQCPMQITGMTV